MKLIQCFFIIIFLSLLTSCESKTFLRSKKKLEKDLQGYWQPVRGTSIYGTSAYDNNILWNFDNGKVYIVKVNQVSDVSIDMGHYSIDSKIDSDYLGITDLKTQEYISKGFNINWDIIQLDKKILSIAGRPFNGGRIEIEFIKTEH